MMHSKGAHARERTPGRGSGMSVVGLRSEPEFSKDEKKANQNQTALTEQRGTWARTCMTCR